ncbi:hypothetical protein ACKKBF_B16510 [Auxenochlorella protothecoides x Auxenochlorella symbiontica]
MSHTGFSHGSIISEMSAPRPTPRKGSAGVPSTSGIVGPVCPHLSRRQGRSPFSTGLGHRAPDPRLAPVRSVSSSLDIPLLPAQSASETLIEFRDVYKSFGDKHILRGASFCVRRGEAVGIIGGSGTGKSTTLRIAAGLLQPDAGQVLVRGVERVGLMADQPDSDGALVMGLVFQSAALFDSLTVGENVGFLLLEHSKLPKTRIKKLVAAALRKVGLRGVENLMPSELSGGMKKRVALARAIIRDDQHAQAEQLIMYDEPTAGLDPVASTVVEDLIRGMHTPTSARSRGGITSYMVVTHQHSTIRRAVDRLIFLNDGKVVWQGTVKEFDACDVPIVRQFASGSLDGPITYV